jgi:hypothetical protein
MRESANPEMLQQLADALAAWNARYRLLCGRCDVDHRIQSRRTSRLQAAEIFYGNGWRLMGGVPVCGKCIKAAPQ